MSKNVLDCFFNPRSVAIVGATSNPISNNFNMVRNLINLGYQGHIYPINPKEESINNIKCYKAIDEVDDFIDLVVISVSVRNVLDVIKSLNGQKVGGVAIVTGGFSETGEEGRKLQDEIATILKQQDIRAIGPNALSPINSRVGMAISFTEIKRLPPGNVSFIFQSGMYEPRFNWIVSDFHLGIAKLIDLGNKMDLTEVDMLEYLMHDEDTKVLCIHLEAVKGDGRKFFELLREAVKFKPVVVLKGGRTEAGAKAAMSHTGSIAMANNIVFDSAMNQAGVTRADTLDDFLYLAKAFSYLPLPRGNQIAVATYPGGEAVLTTDACSQYGLVMAKPGRESYDKLKSSFPPWEINLNPYDLGAISPFHPLQNHHEAYILAMTEDENVDCLALELPYDLWPFKSVDCCSKFSIAAERGKPLAMWQLAMLKFNDEITEYLEEHRIPVFPSAAITIKCLGALYQYRMWKKTH